MGGMASAEVGAADERLGHRPGLDGLRGVAILLVLGLHWWPAWFPGGNIGVDLFFVLSGFLITRLLIEEHDRTGRVDLRGFYLRRARRLAPALGVLLAVCATASGAIWTLLYVANWSRAAGGMQGPLEHTWTLAIEEQFYVLWPLAFGLVARSRRPVVMLLAICAVVLAWRLLLLDGGAELIRLRAGTDTRADALLIGCAAAFALPVLARIRWAPFAALAALAAVPVVLGFGQVGMFGAGFTLVAVGAAVLVLWALDWNPPGWLRWFGRLSYSIYLWHYPITWALRGGDPHATAWDTTALAIALSLAAAVASYRLIERPFRAMAPAPRRAETLTPTARRRSVSREGSTGLRATLRTVVPPALSR